jgi:hypothetical protein
MRPQRYMVFYSYDEAENARNGGNHNVSERHKVDSIFYYRSM